MTRDTTAVYIGRPLGTRRAFQFTFDSTAATRCRKSAAKMRQQPDAVILITDNFRQILFTDNRQEILKHRQITDKYYLLTFTDYRTDKYRLTTTDKIPINTTCRQQTKNSQGKTSESVHCTILNGVKTLQTQDISALVPKCLMDTSAPVPNCPDISALVPKYLGTLRH